MNIRPATLADIPVLLEMQREGWTQDYVGLAPEGYLVAAHNYFAQAAQVEQYIQENRYYWVAESHEPMGCLCADHLDDSKAVLWWIHTLQRHRSKGVGRELLNQLVTQLPDEIKTVYVTTFETYQPTIAFYRSMGFVRNRSKRSELFGYSVEELELKLEL